MRLAAGESYRRIKPVDISGVVPLLDGLPWFNVHREGKTPEAYGCDVVRVAQFPKPLLDLVDGLGLGGTLARAMLRRLKPRQCIPLHTDTWMPAGRDWRRFQVPLVSDNFVVMQWPDVGKAVWLEPGFLWEVRYETPHEVVNCSDNPRIHLQIDVVDATI
jgi:hypothetical protein